MSKVRHIMVDIECLGLKPGCKILQIGATTFNTDSPELFSINILRNSQYDLIEDPKTVAWWESQSEDAKKAVLTPDIADTLDRALYLFSNYILNMREAGVGKIALWSKPASFDLRILEAAYEYTGIPVPWNFREEMCFRTLYNLLPNAMAPQFEGERHIALDDAVNQAHHAEHIFEAIHLGYYIP